MNQEKAPMQPTLFESTPTASCQGSNFYTFYGVSMGPVNFIQYTYYTGTWGTKPLTGPQSALSSVPAPKSQAVIKSITVGDVVCVVYPSSDLDLIILTSTGPNTFEKRASYTTGTSIGSFCLYTDEQYLYFITNENGVLYSHRLNGNSVDSKTQLNGEGGGSASAPSANTSSELAAGFYHSQLHCVYKATNNVVDVFQTISGWDSATIINSTKQYRSFEFFTRDSKFYLVSADYMGEINVSMFLAGNPQPWSEVYYTGGNSLIPPPASAASLAHSQLGVFAFYKDQYGKTWCAFSLNENPNAWDVLQIGGTGAGDYFDPSAPLSVFNSCTTVYNGYFVHCIYNTGGNKIYDIYWALRWHGADLFPSVPSMTSDMEFENIDENTKMFE